MASLERDDTLGEQVEAFASRYSRLQDTLGEKLFPRLLELVGQRGRALIDTLNQIERLGIIADGREWLAWRNLRNSLVHEYVESPEEFAAVLNTAYACSGALLTVITAIEKRLIDTGVELVGNPDF